MDNTVLLPDGFTEDDSLTEEGFYALPPLQQRRYLRGCRGKHRYKLAAARKASRLLSERDGEEMDAYKCPFCPPWADGRPVYHLGHTPPVYKKGSKIAERMALDAIVSMEVANR